MIFVSKDDHFFFIVLLTIFPIEKKPLTKTFDKCQIQKTIKLEAKWQRSI